jgi:hypothetical protein
VEVASTTWRADGVTYHAMIQGDPADTTIKEALASMRFAGGTPAVPGQVDEGSITREAYVVASGVGGGGPWNLLASSDPEPCLALSVGRPAWACNLGAATPPWLTVDHGSEGLALFGVLQPDVSSLQDWGDDGSAWSVPVVALPEAFGSLRGFATWKPADASGTLVATGGVTPAPWRYGGIDRAAGPVADVTHAGSNDWYTYDVVAQPRPGGLIHVLVYATWKGRPQGMGLVAEAIVATPSAGAIAAAAFDMSDIAPPSDSPGASVLVIALLPDGTRYVQRDFGDGAVRADRQVAPHLFTSGTRAGLAREFFASTTEGTSVAVDSVTVSALDEDADEIARVEVPVIG